MKELTLKTTLRECLKNFPELEEQLYRLIEECVYCEGFQDEPLEEVFKAHRLDPEKALKELKKALNS